MAVNIEKMRSDMRSDIERLRLQKAHQSWTIPLQAIALFVAGVAAAAAWFKFFYP